MAIKITTGDSDYEVLDSGSIISFKDEPITFRIETDLVFRFRFQNDTEKKDQRMDYKPINNKELEIILVNFNSSLGVGNATPLPLGSINNRKLYLNFMVYALNEHSSKTVHYSWYLREEVTNA